MRFHFSNFPVKFGYPCFIVRNSLVEGLLSADVLLYINFKITKFSLACFIEITLKPHFVVLRLDLEIGILTKVELLTKVGKESFKFNKYLANEAGSA